jgi:hypothetical protein
MERDLDDQCVVLHSLNLMRHPTKLDGETDFVVLSTRGIFVIEVKGGYVSCQDGFWKYEDPLTGRFYTKREGPFAQAQGALHALLDAVQRAPALGRLLVGSGVIMPNCTFTAEGAEIEPRVLLDARRFHEPLSRFIGALATHWEGVYRSRYGHVPRAPTPAQIRELRQTLRPDAESTPALATLFNGLDEHMLWLTDQQVRAARGLENNPRSIVTGRAGTGKTVVAIDRARRLAAAGQRVRYLCFNQLLARHVREALASDPNAERIDVAHLHGLMAGTIADAGLSARVQTGEMDNAELFSRIYPEVFVDAALGHGLPAVDALVVDEAQDLLTIPNLDAMDLMLVGGLRDGRWAFFMDPLQNIYGKAAEDAMDVLQAAGFASYTLTENCRNTREVAVQCSIISGVDVALEGAATGPSCDCIYYRDPADFQKRLESELTRLLRSGVSARDIIILSTRRKAASLVAAVTAPGGVPLHDLAEGPGPASALHFSTMHGFKGLERRVVLAVDLEDIGADEAALLHYAGLSRATTLLRPFLPERCRAPYGTQAVRFGERLQSNSA